MVLEKEPGSSNFSTRYYDCLGTHKAPLCVGVLFIVTQLSKINSQRNQTYNAGWIIPMSQPGWLIILFHTSFYAYHYIFSYIFFLLKCIINISCFRSETGRTTSVVVNILKRILHCFKLSSVNLKLPCLELLKSFVEIQRTEVSDAKVFGHEILNKSLALIK